MRWAILTVDIVLGFGNRICKKKEMQENSFTRVFSIGIAKKYIEIRKSVIKVYISQLYACKCNMYLIYFSTKKITKGILIFFEFIFILLISAY